MILCEVLLCYVILTMSHQSIPAKKVKKIFNTHRLTPDMNAPLNSVSTSFVSTLGPPSSAPSTSEASTTLSYIPLVCFLFGMMGASMAITNAPGILSNEYFPTAIRPQVCSLYLICLICTLGTLQNKYEKNYPSPSFLLGFSLLFFSFIEFYKTKINLLEQNLNKVEKEAMTYFKF